MPWLTIEDTAKHLHLSERQVWRWIKKYQQPTELDGEGRKLVWVEERSLEGAPEASDELEIPEVPATELTEEVLEKVKVMFASITAEGEVSKVEEEIQRTYSLPVSTQQRYKLELRRFLQFPSRSSLDEMARHGQLRQALAYVIARTSPGTKGTLRSGKRFSIVRPTGELFAMEDFLISLFSHKGHNARSCYRAVLKECKLGNLVDNVHGEMPTLDELPSERTVRRWLYMREKMNLALKRSRQSQSERRADEFYISRPADEYAPGEKLEGDHTEDVTLVYRNDGKIAPLWTTILVDFRTNMVKGWVHSYRPNSNTIALAYRNAVLGNQLEVLLTDGTYRPLGVVDVPRILVYDNGKDYRSRYTNQVIGKIDFQDEARLVVQTLSEVHYTTKRHPQSKGTVERTFRSIQEILKYLPGHKGSNYSAKPDELALQKKRGELLTEDQYKQLFKMAVNTFNNRPSESLDGATPIEFYLKNKGIRYSVDERVLNWLMMKVEKRRIARGYVHLFGQEYFSGDLDSYNRKQVSLYYDPQDMGRVAVYEKKTFLSFAVNIDLMGKTERELLSLVKERARQNKEIAQEIASMRGDITSEEAKMMLFGSEISDGRAMSGETLQRKVPEVVKFMGIEQEAKEIDQYTKDQKRTEEARRKVKQDPNQILRRIDVSRMR